MTEETVEAPETLIVFTITEDKVEAPDTERELEIVAAPVTANVPFNCELPVTKRELTEAPKTLKECFTLAESREKVEAPVEDAIKASSDERVAGVEMSRERLELIASER